MPTAALPRAFNLRGWSYCLDFVVMPPVALLLAVYAGGAGLLWVLFGAIAWTLAEYGIHRFVFHSFPMFRRMHDVHHAKPKDWIGVATWGTSVAFGLAWLVACSISTAVIASAFIAGVIAAYLFYCGIHVRFHHGNPQRMGRYVAFMARHHSGHHRGARGNFGVSSPIWDLAFGTYRSSKKGIPPC